MNLTLKPTVACILLALSQSPDASTFEVSKTKVAKKNHSENDSKKRNLILNAAEFDPVSEKITLEGVSDNQNSFSKFGLIQFFQQDKNSLDRINEMGAKVINYLPHDAYVVQWDKSSKKALQESNSFRYVGDYKPVYKLSPYLWNSAKSLKTEQSHIEIELFGFKGTSSKNLKFLLMKSNNDTFIERTDVLNGVPYVKATIKSDVKATIMKLIEAQDVMWVDRYLHQQTYNIDSVGPIQSNESGITEATIWNHGITGTGQIVAVADSGLDRNQDFFSQYNTGSGAVTKKYTNATYPGASTVGELNLDHKVIGYFVQPGASEYDDDAECTEDSGGSSFHGTHVTGTVAGDSGTPANATNANYDEGDGMAPHAQILFQDLGNTQTGCLSGAGGYGMFKQAAEAGAGISSNSYGSNAVEDEANDGYFTNDQQADQASYDFENMLIVFAAGNDGNTGLGHPAHAKNVLSVGALGHGISTNTAVFSSRGPAYDGRRKPDIVAPGVGIFSAGGNLDNAIPPTQSPNAISRLSGTSMATPTVSGGLALMRQYFMDGFYPSGSKNSTDALKPTGSLLKSTVLNGTVVLPRTPSNDRGWGRIWLDNNLYFDGDSKALRVWDLPNSNGLTTNEEMSFKVNVPAGEAFRATLSWFDPPAALGNGLALINDLDLEVKFNGQTYKGNNWNNSESVSGGDADNINNVEQIHIPNPASGEYEIIVKGTQINGSGASETRKQGFALVTSQAHCSASVSSSGSINVTDSVQGEPMITLEPVDGVNDYQLYRKSGTCAADNSGYQFIGQFNGGANQLSLLDVGTENGLDYSYAVRGVNECGEGSYSSCKTIQSNASCTSEPQFDSLSVTAVTGGEYCSASLQWPAATSTCDVNGAMKYNIYRSQDSEFSPTAEHRIASGVSARNYEDFTTESNVVYYYIVTAVDPLGNEQFNQDIASVFTTGDNFVAGDFVDDPDNNGLATLESPWKINDRIASTGSLSYHNSDPGVSYPANTCAYLTLPEVELQSSGASLSYDARYNLEVNWDGVVVEISNDGGSTWQDLPPNGGYPSDFSQTEPTPGEPINACGYRRTQGAFNGAQNSFTTYTSDLSAFAGDKVMVRWAFSSDPGSQEDGFYLDNIQLENSSSPGMCEVKAINKNNSGPWINPAESGHGLFLEVGSGFNNGPDRLTSYWYTYLNGEPKWIFGTGSTNGNSATLDMFSTSGGIAPPDFNASDVVIEPWGTLNFDFENSNQGELSWNSVIAGYGAGSIPISKLALIGDSKQSCFSGSYSDPSQSGHGYVVEILGDAGSEIVLVTWYSYDPNGNQIWLIGSGQLNGSTATVPVSIFNGAQFPPQFVPGDVESQEWGTLSLDFSVNNSLQVSWTANLDGYSNGQITAAKLTELKGRGCY